LGWPPRFLETVSILARVGVIRPLGPVALFRIARIARRWGISPPAAYAVACAAGGAETALIDERGRQTFAEVEAGSNAIARGLRESGVGPGVAVGVMCRDDRGFVLSVVALWKLGATSILLNTSFAGPQVAAVVEKEGASVLIHDEEFEPLLAPLGEGRRRFWALHESAAPAGVGLLDDLAAGDPGGPLDAPAKRGRTIILTSGTTGTPKGAARSTPTSLSPALALLSRIPLHRRDTTLIAAPLFHTWGYSHFQIGLLLAATIVLQRRFDPEATLKRIAEHRVTVLIVVPVMLQRILELPAETRQRYDTSSLRVVAASGSALPGELATKFMDEFGDVLYNLYGSTEVAWATIASPADLRAAPGTAGRVPSRTRVRILDAAGGEVAPGTVGRVFVGNEFPFEGYTGGGAKPVVDGLMGTGDMGRMDVEGRLFIEGRDDEMIVSGGENVYPGEVEDLLARHPAVVEVAVVGVADPKFGQALKAFVVKRGVVAEEDLRAYVRDNLARYKVPRQIEFMTELPRNGAGKVMKRELAGGDEAGAVDRA